MSRDDYRKRLAEREGTALATDPERLKPRPPQWLIDRILEQCAGQPGPMLTPWLGGRQVFADDTSAWQFERQSTRHWQNRQDVLRAAASLDGHPMRGHLGAMLGALVARHAPQNMKFVPPEFHQQEPR